MTTPTPAAPAAKTAKPLAATPVKPKTKPISEGFFSIGRVALDTVPDEAAAYAQHAGLMKKLAGRPIVIAGLCTVMIFAIPIFQPVYHYYALSPAGETGAIMP